jgi:hypothetical protein
VPKYRAADVPLKPDKALKEDLMERRMETRFRRMLRLFWKTVCPYEIHWGMEQQQARAYSTGRIELGEVPRLRSRNAIRQEARVESKRQQ